MIYNAMPFTSSQSIVNALKGQDIGVQSITFTSPVDQSTFTFDMAFGFGYLTGSSANSGGFGGFQVQGQTMYVDGFLATTADPSADPPVVSGQYAWQSGQGFFEDATVPSLSSQYIGVNTNFQIGYAPGGGSPARKFYVDAGTGDVTTTGSISAAGTVASNTLLATNGNLSVQGQMWLGGSASATVPGSVAKKLEVFDTAGSSIGFLAIYSSIG